MSGKAEVRGEKDRSWGYSGRARPGVRRPGFSQEETFAAAPTGPFSLNLLYDRAQATGRLHGLRHDGEWLHIGTPEALRDAENALARLLAELEPDDRKDLTGRAVTIVRMLDE